jgi:hypothetical protein
LVFLFWEKKKNSIFFYFLEWWCFEFFNLCSFCAWVCVGWVKQ